MLPATELRVVVPFTPRPTPVCVTVAVLEVLPCPWVEAVVNVQLPAKLVGVDALELLLLPLQPAKRNTTVLKSRIANLE